MNNPREITSQNIYKIIKQHTLPDDSLDTPFCKMLTYTVCRHACSLSHLIKKYLAKKLSPKYDFINIILLTASAELLFMDSPDYAVINSYVDIAKKHSGKKFGGLTNAILRNILREKDSILEQYQQRFFPNPFIQILTKDYNKETISQIEKIAIKQAPLNISIKNDIDRWATTLNAQKVNNHTLALTSTNKIEDIEGYHEGEWWVQDTSAALAAVSFSEIKGKRILDLCAAPGGKTAQLINAGAKVTSLDCSQHRLKTLEQNLKRLNLITENIICDDALHYLQNFNEEPFDAILLDAPCSATGVFRRHPEIVFLKTEKDIEQQAKLQRQILNNISPALKNGGELVYCTCSIAKKEGENQISSFLNQHKNYHLVPLNNIEEPSSITPEGYIRTLPHHYSSTGGCDAFFIAKLRKE